jgi:hypothetical protein
MKGHRCAVGLVKRGSAFLSIVLGFVLALSACRSMGASTPAATVTVQPSEPAATASPSASPLVSTILSTTTTEPTAPLISAPPTIAATPALPVLVGKDFYFGDMFFERSDSPSCSLPCWHNLVMGQSTEAEVLHEFEAMVGPSYSEEANLGLLMNDASETVPDIYDRGFTYTSDVEIVELGGDEFRNFGEFSGFAVFSSDAKRLQLLGFHWLTTADSQLEVHLSPQRVIKEMGPPTSMLVGGGNFWIDLLLVYDEGIVFQYTNDKPSVSETKDQYCFGDTQVQIMGAFIMGSLYILEPFGDGLNRLSPLQDTTVGAAIRWSDLQPPEKFFGLSQDEIVEKILHEEDTCLLLDAGN